MLKKRISLIIIFFNSVPWKQSKYVDIFTSYGALTDMEETSYHAKLMFLVLIVKNKAVQLSTGLLLPSDLLRVLITNMLKELFMII